MHDPLTERLRRWLRVGLAGLTVTAAVVTAAPAAGAATAQEFQAGRAYHPGSSTCTIGFGVQAGGGPEGFVTAGHCGGVGTSVRYYTQAPMGTVAGSYFPGRDMAWVAVSTSWTPTAQIYTYPGTVTVVGATDTPIDGVVCSVDAATGLTCGTVLGYNRQVWSGGGWLYGQVEHTACTGPGGGGGPVFTPTGEGDEVLALGTNSAVGSGQDPCRSYYQPIGETLSYYGLSLVTG